MVNFNRVEVKCPKCRYRYDTPVSSGENEVACVCPRCGVPFTFAVGEGADSLKNQVREEEKPLQERGWNPTATEPKRTDEAQTTPSTTPETRKTETPPPFIPSITSRRGSGNRFNSEYQRKDRGCLRNCLLAFIVTFVVAVFFVRNCNESHSYTSGFFQDKDEEFEESKAVSDNDVAPANSEMPPHWLEGTWRVEAEYGVVVVTIRGNRIVEQLPDGEMNRGTFVYKKERIYCDFGDEMVMMKVNVKKRYIQYGDQPMEKQ